MVRGKEEEEEVSHGAAEEHQGRGVTSVRSFRRSSGDWQRDLRNEDVGGDRPRVGSHTEQAVSFAHGRREEPDFLVAMIVKRIARGRKVPQYVAIVGEAEEIRLTAPTHNSLNDEERELLGLKAGDLVAVREKVVASFTGIKTSWVMVKRLNVERTNPQVPVLVARVHTAEHEAGEACVVGMDNLLEIDLEEGELNEEVKLKVGNYFRFVPVFGEDERLLPIKWKDVLPYGEDDVEEEVDGKVRPSSDDSRKLSLRWSRGYGVCAKAV